MSTPDEIEINSLAYAIDRLRRELLEMEYKMAGFAAALKYLEELERQRKLDEMRAKHELEHK